jgi:ubiquinone/menaquinone biosynthesis C-methylase UbiE
MNSVIAENLLALNREFYDRFGDQFSATRQRLQPGVKKVLESIQDDVSVLDLGCGNGYFLRELSRRGHKQPFLGVDFSLPLLRDAESQPAGFSAKFAEADLTQLPVFSDQLSVISVSISWPLNTVY